MTRLLVDRLVDFNNERLRLIFGERVTELTREIIERRRGDLGSALDALQRQYPDDVAALEVRFLRQSAVRQETGRYQALFEEGLIPQELFEDLKRGVIRIPGYYRIVVYSARISLGANRAPRRRRTANGSSRGRQRSSSTPSRRRP